MQCYTVVTVINKLFDTSDKLKLFVFKGLYQVAHLFVLYTSEIIILVNNKVGNLLCIFTSCGLA